MTTRTRLNAELATRRYTRRHAREIVTAMLGNNSGTVVAVTDTRWYNIRLHGDPNQVVRAWNTGFVPPVPNLPVDVEIVKANGITDYQIIGVSLNRGVVADVNAGATGSHALQHQRRDFNTGGFDPLDIYGRAIVQLRARAQATPDMTLYVEAGWYSVAGIATYFAGGNSPAFTAPASGFRCDLLYLDNTGTLQIVTGTGVPFGTPARPAQPSADDLPLAYVYLTAATTSVTEYLIEDGRMVFGGAGGGVGAHNILSATHGDTTVSAPNDKDRLTWDAGSGKWVAAALPDTASGLITGADPFTSTIVSDASTTSPANDFGQQSSLASTNRSGVIWQAYVFYNSSDKVAIAVRKVPGEWTIYATALSFPGGGEIHHYAAIGIDPNGYLHVAWGMHNNSLKYFKSTLPIESFAGAITGNLSMLGTNESSVTYPVWANDPSGKLYFMFRDGIAGNGDLYFYKYNEGTTTWAAATGTSANGKLINGKGTPANPYWLGPYFDPNFGSGGKMHLFWSWYAAATNYSYLQHVAWDGTNFTKASGLAQTVPITPANSENVDPPGNTTVMPSAQLMLVGTDAGGHPHVAYSRNDGAGNNCLYHSWHNGSAWVVLQIDAVASGGPYIPGVLGIDRETNIVWVVYENQGEGDSYLRLIFSAPNDYTTWTKVVLWPHATEAALDTWYRPSMDQAEWERNHRFMITIPYYPGASAHPAPISVLNFVPSEWALWDAANFPQFHTNDTDTATSALHHTLGTGANQACAGNDARLSDSRTPTAHALVGALHTAAGLTVGDVLTATGAAAFAFQTPAAGGGGGHLHGLDRWVADGSTTFNLLDLAEYVNWVTDNGSSVDPLTITLSADLSQIVFDSAPTSGHILTAGYVIAGA